MQSRCRCKRRVARRGGEGEEPERGPTRGDRENRTRRGQRADQPRLHGREGRGVQCLAVAGPQRTRDTPRSATRRDATRWRRVRGPPVGSQKGLRHPICHVRGRPGRAHGQTQTPDGRERNAGSHRAQQCRVATSPPSCGALLARLSPAASPSHASVAARAAARPMRPPEAAAAAEHRQVTPPVDAITAAACHMGRSPSSRPPTTSQLRMSSIRGGAVDANTSTRGGTCQDACKQRKKEEQAPFKAPPTRAPAAPRKQASSYKTDEPATAAIPGRRPHTGRRHQEGGAGDPSRMRAAAGPTARSHHVSAAQRKTIFPTCRVRREHARQKCCGVRWAAARAGRRDWERHRWHRVPPSLHGRNTADRVLAPR